MKKTLSLVLSIVLCFGLLSTAVYAETFRDVDAEAYYYDAVEWAVGKNITKGTCDTTFSPDEECTRRQVVTFLYRAVAQ